ncbi:MAG: SDR family NAD(P)-dependent oxidoreductase [Actinobacteria bacterium]|nr:SDR family NAD(P)-dependent oxidoreductase [Actinomycetota bacterium]
MTRPLEGTVALVTGASSGIGAATGRHLASLGASVALVARRTDRLLELVDEIGADGGRAIPLTVDVTDADRAGMAVEATIDEFGRLDTVVNNAGVMLLGPALGAPLDEWERMVDLNVKGLLYVAHAALPHLVAAAGSGARGVADLVNISSVAGRIARAGSGVYNLTKHGVGAFSESLRQEFAPQHVRISVVEPGLVATELGMHLRPEIIEGMVKRFEGTEALSALDIAETIGFIVTRDRRVAINEMLVRPTNQVG